MMAESNTDQWYERISSEGRHKTTCITLTTVNATMNAPLRSQISYKIIYVLISSLKLFFFRFGISYEQGRAISAELIKTIGQPFYIIVLITNRMRTEFKNVLHATVQNE